MDNPVTAAKAALNVRTIIMALVAFLIIAFIFGVFGISNWLINPFSALSGKFPAVGKLYLGPGGGTQ